MPRFRAVRMMALGPILTASWAYTVLTDDCVAWATVIRSSTLPALRTVQM